MMSGANNVIPRMFRVLRNGSAFLAMAFSCSALSCASGGGVQNVERVRGYSEEGNAGRDGVAYVPRGAYLVGQSAQSLAVGAWLRVLPGAGWPGEVAKPTVLVGRVASKESFGARIEILAAQSGLRDRAPDVEIYDLTANGDESQTPRLHAMPKRLVYPLAAPAPSDEIVATGLGTDDWVEGSELYGIIDLGATAEQRLASRMTGIGTIADNAPGRDEIAIARVAGSWPRARAESDSNADDFALVLLDAPDSPAYDVRISLYGSALLPLKNHLESLLEPNLPGRDRLRIDWHDMVIPPSSLSELSQQETDMLEIRVFQDGGRLDAYDQGIRVGRLPWRASLSDMAPDSVSAATAVAMNALGLLGYHASAAYLGERIWNDAEIEEKLALVPALAEAYHAMARDDWALEIGFELAGYAKRSSGELRYKLLASQAVIASMTRRSSEFSPIYETVNRHIDELSASWQRAFRYALMASGSEDHDVLLRKLLRRDKVARQTGIGAWSEVDDLQLCLMAFDRFVTGAGNELDTWAEYCESRAQNAQWPLTVVSYEALQVLQDRSEADDDSHMSEMLAISARVDDLGYPHLASMMWREIALHASTDEAVVKAWQNAAEYARLSQQKRLYLQMMSELARWMRQRSLELSGEIFASAIAGWRALDMRQSLAEMFVARAQGVDRAIADELLKRAADLFLSSGDGANYEVVRSLQRHNDAQQAIQ